MNLLKIVAQIVLLYILYRLVVNFIIPTYRNISRFRKQFRQMQQEMQKQYNEQQPRHGQQASPPPPKEEKTVKNREGEYIDFEDIKS